jgi:hypothetical protein
MPTSSAPRGSRLPRWLLAAGVAVASAPLVVSGLVALVTGGSMWDESQGSGAILWLMVLTVPLGILMAIAGLVAAAVIGTRRRRQP